MKLTILLISADNDLGDVVKARLDNGRELIRARTLSQGIGRFKTGAPGVVLVDVSLVADLDRAGLKALFADFWAINPMARFIVLATKGYLQRAVKAVEAGATSYLLHPGGLPQIGQAIDSVVRHIDGTRQAEQFIPQDGSSAEPQMRRTRSEVMKRVFEKISLVSQTETTVLLSGETGVGKGVIANLIHQKSNRSAGPMLSVHCGAIPDALIETELFGHEKGAFTGAIRSKKGKFEQASKGTIFLDEIGTVTAATQIKLLQVLQDRTFQPVGSDRTLVTDVRVIAASNSDLEQMVEQDEFRRDLYFRLNIFPIEVPALRQRKEDIPLFVSFFVDQLNSKYDKQIKGAAPEVMDAFQRYAWPGNIREMENLLQRAFILEKSPFLRPQAFPSDLFGPSGKEEPPARAYFETLSTVRRKAVDKVEVDYLTAVLKAHSGRINPAATTAGISRRQLHKLLTKHGIKKEDFKHPRRSAG